MADSSFRPKGKPAALASAKGGGVILTATVDGIGDIEVDFQPVDAMHFVTTVQRDVLNGMSSGSMPNMLTVVANDLSLAHSPQQSALLLFTNIGPIVLPTAPQQRSVIRQMLDQLDARDRALGSRN